MVNLANVAKAYCATFLLFSTLESNHAEELSETKEVVALGVVPCTFEITAKKNSHWANNSNGYVGFTEYGGEKANGLSFVFQCRRNPENHYCTSTWREVNLSDLPENLKVMNIKEYRGIHPLYEAAAISANMTAVNPPRSRSLYFCLANSDKVVEGSVGIGNEVRDRAPAALRILKTLKIQ